MTRQRLNAQEAAEILGISVDAVRMRARRGTLDSEHEKGRLYVWLDADETNVHPQGQVEALLQEKNERLEELREEVHHFREILSEEREARRRADTIIAQLTQANATLAARLPELEAPSEPRQEPVSPGPTETTETTTEPAAGRENVSERPWWRRIFE
jgi:hypothetical protein